MNWINELPKETSIGILGFGAEGKSTLRWLLAQGFTQISLLDSHPLDSNEVPHGVKLFAGKNYLESLADLNVVFRSAGIRPDLPEIAAFTKNGGILTSQIELFFDIVPLDKIIGVTGTLGKGSCLTMIEKILKDNHFKVEVGGNIGTPALDLLLSDLVEPFFLLELSSFQLSSLQKSPHRSVVLQVTSEHLDWHLDLTEYRMAKTSIVRYQNRKDLCVYNSDSIGSSLIAATGKARLSDYGSSEMAACIIKEDRILFKGEVLLFEECRLNGNFQLENMAAAILVADDMGVSIGSIFKSLRNYESLQFRFQWVGKKEGIQFINDSYATRPDATIGALKSNLPGSKVLILGGSEKFADFSELAQELPKVSDLNGICLIGDTSHRLRDEIKKYITEEKIHLCQTLETAFDKGVSLLKNSGSGFLIMSPACASFGLFKNYKHRGEVFNRLVQDYCS